MPYRVRKQKGRRPYKIQAKRAAGWRTVGSSRTKGKAKASARVRQRAER